jgi:hypothetical protein
MSVAEDFKKKSKTVQEQLTKKEKEIIDLFKYKDFFEKETKEYIDKIKKKCEEGMEYLSDTKDENKMTVHQDLISALDNLMKEMEQLVNNLNSSVKALKSFLSKDPNIISKEEKKKKNNKNKLVIKSTDDFRTAKGILNSDDASKLETIEINRITTDDFNNLFKDFKKKEQANNNDNKNEEILKIKKFKIKKSILLNTNLNDYFPDIENLNISDCKIGYNVCQKLEFNNLIKLSLDNIELVNDNFMDILIFLLKGRPTIKSNDYIGKNLKMLSVKNNRISHITIPGVEASDDRKFNNDFGNLEYLNLSGNNLYDFCLNTSLFNSVTLLDLTKNNISSPVIINNILDDKGENCLILAAKNVGVMKNKKIKAKYCDYLVKKLTDSQANNKKKKYNIKSLNFEGIFMLKDNIKNKDDNENQPYLFRIDLNTFSNTLVQLNLSFNNISNDIIYKLFEKNRLLPNLKELDLSSNKITEDFFSKYVSNKYYENYNNLKILNLSRNPILFKEANTYKNFILNCKSLESLIIKHTSVGEEINDYMKKKILYANHQYNGDKKYSEMEKFIDRDRFLTKNTNVYITVSYIVKQKYIAWINKYFPYLLARIKLEE